MPVTADLPPFSSHEAFEPLREQIDQAKQEATDRAFLKVREEQAREWRGRRALIADDGVPAKKLTVERRQQQRALVAAEITVEMIDELLGWFGQAHRRLSALRHARAG